MYQVLVETISSFMEMTEIDQSLCFKYLNLCKYQETQL